MNRQTAIACFWTAAFPIVAAAQSSIDISMAVDLRNRETSAVRVQPVRTGPGAIRATFEPADWPNVKFRARSGKPWDWSRFTNLIIEIKNPGAHPIALGIRIDDDASADGISHCRTAHARLKPSETATFRVPLVKNDPMSHGMRGLPGYKGSRGLEASGQGLFDLRHIVAFQVFMDHPRVAQTIEILSVRLTEKVSMDSIVDAFGQYSRSDWPGKLHTESELIEQHKAEADDLKSHPALLDRDRFGGFRGGPTQEATGFFRTTKLDGKWWLVDPEGQLFISLGVDVVSPEESTIVTGRESMFERLPRDGEPLARHFGHVNGIHSGPVKSGRTYNFYRANLERTFGIEYLESWREATLSRLQSWGFNTVGNWSDNRLYRNGRVPYVATVTVDGHHARVPSGSDYWGKMHDPFDPRFATSVAACLREVTGRVKGDPWCLGYFVDNELSWGGFGDEAGRYGLALGTLSLESRTSPAKHAMLAHLKQQYGSIQKLNTAWETSLARWGDLEPGWKPASAALAWSPEFRADLGGFVKVLARAYFKTVRDALKAADPDHLYLGCRFAWRTNEAIAAASEFCDVVSFNIYERKVDPEKWAFLNTLDRPAIIGEFHAGALDRGMFHTGLVSAASQAERASIYRNYVASVLDHPALVGCHWFQYVDEPLTGRAFDGENYNIGFVSVTDTPYPEMIASARSIHSEAYTRRSGTNADSRPR